MVTVWKLLVALVIVVPILLSGLGNLRDGADLFGWILWAVGSVAWSALVLALARVVGKLSTALHAHIRDGLDGLRPSWWGDLYHAWHCASRHHNLSTVETWADDLLKDFARDPAHADIILRNALRSAYSMGRFDAMRPRADRWTPPESVEKP